MIRTRFKKVLLVAPDIFPEQLLNNCEVVKHISAAAGIFPALYQLNPDTIILDYDYIGEDIEKILRRIQINKFYDKLRVCCYKKNPHTKTDSFLKALGVDQLVYAADIVTLQKSKTVLDNVSNILDSSILKWVANVSH